MAEFCKFAGQILYRSTGDEITDFYGRKLYVLQRNEIKEWASGKILYRVDGDDIRDFYGRILYRFDGEKFKDFYGRCLYEYRNGKISPFAQNIEYVVYGSASKMEIIAFFLLFVINS